MNTQNFPGLKVVIVNWCRPVDTIECIRSVLENQLAEDQMIVVDNGSNDDSVSQIRGVFPGIDLLCLPENLGFAGGYNHGIKTALESGATSIFILNNDTVIDREAISSLNASAWDVSVPKIYFHESPGIIWSAGAQWRWYPPMVIMRGYQHRDSPRYGKVVELNYATACALMVKSIVFEKAGLFDPQYKNYFEDYDFFYRVHQSGFKVGFIPQAKIWHKVARTLGSKSPERLWYLGRNCVLFYRKENRFPSWALYSFLGWVSLREIIKLNLQEIRYFWKGVYSGMEWIKHGSSAM